VVQTLTPARRNLKKQFYDAVKSKNFVGDKTAREAAAAHVTAAFRNFAQRFELPVGEEDVLLSRFGSISGIGTADLSSAPIYDTTKDTLTAFFGSHHGRQSVDDIHQSNSQQQMNNMPMEIQESYMAQNSYQGMNETSTRGPFAHQRKQPPSNDFQRTSQDSMVGMVIEDAERMGFSQFDSREDPSENMSATPQLVSQQFVPRQQQQHQQQQQHAPMQLYNQGPPPNGESRRLLEQFNRPPMGNPIRPFSSYSAASGNHGGFTMPGYFG